MVRASLDAIADDDDQVGRRIGADRAGLRREAFEQLHDRLHREDRRNGITRVSVARLQAVSAPVWCGRCRLLRRLERCDSPPRKTASLV